MNAENYTSVCWYCGVIYHANRSTSHFCQNKHRSLYYKYGPQINPLVLGRNGEWTHADEKLSLIDFNSKRPDEEGWSYCYNVESIEEKYGYYGPLPKGEEIIIVGSYAMARSRAKNGTDYTYIGVKHISKLTLQERATRQILKRED